MSLKQKIYLYISDVASYIGQNKWDYITPFERLWKRCDTKNYENILMQTNILLKQKNIDFNNYESQKSQIHDDFANKKITKRQLDIRIKKCEDEQKMIAKDIVEIKEKVDDVYLTQKEKIQKIVGEEMVKKLDSDKIETNMKKQLINEELDSLDLTENQRIELQKQSESYINKTHGTLKEDTAIEMFEKKFGVKLDVSQEFNKRYLSELSKDSKYDWFICGKVDGLYLSEQNPESNYIVEVKNRTKAFFNNLRDYEKTQIHLYMWMLNIPNSKLVEKYNEKIRITQIYENTDYTKEIIDSVSVFAKHFENDFLSDNTVKLSYILKSKDEKEKYIYKNFFKKIENCINEKKQDLQKDEDCMIEDDF